jgi:hypothetical protein
MEAFSERQLPAQATVSAPASAPRIPFIYMNKHAVTEALNLLPVA